MDTKNKYQWSLLCLAHLMNIIFCILFQYFSHNIETFFCQGEFRPIKSSPAKEKTRMSVQASQTHVCCVSKTVTAGKSTYVTSRYWHTCFCQRWLFQKRNIRAFATQNWHTCYFAVVLLYLASKTSSWQKHVCNLWKLCMIGKWNTCCKGKFNGIPFHWWMSYYSSNFALVCIPTGVGRVRELNWMNWMKVLGLRAPNWTERTLQTKWWLGNWTVLNWSQTILHFERKDPVS